MMNKLKKCLSEYWPIFLGVGVFLSGFVAMSVFWALDSGNDLRGFYYYNAATFGDAIALPLLVISLGFLFKQMMQKSDSSFRKKVKYAVIVIFLLGFLAGVLCQISWLLNPKTLENWTIHKKTTEDGIFKMWFNCAGKYHAAFFAISLGLISSLTVMVAFLRVIIHRSYCDSHRLKIEKTLLGVMSFAGCLYLELHFSDDVDGREYSSIYGIMITKVFLLLMLLFVVVFAVLPMIKSIMHNKKAATMEDSSTTSMIVKNARGEIFSILSGGVLAVALVNEIILPSFSRITVICSVLVSIGFVWIVFSNDGKETISKLKSITVLLLTLGINWGIVTSCVDHSPSLFTLIWLMMLFFWPYEFYKNYYDELLIPGVRKRIGVVLAIIAYFVLFAVLDKTLSEIVMSFVSYASYPIIVLGVVAARQLFYPVKELDKIVNISSKNKMQKLLQYVKIAIIIFTCFSWLIHEVSKKTKPFASNMSGLFIKPTHEIMVYLFVLVTMAIITCLIRKANLKVAQVMTCFLCAALYILINCSMIKSMGFSVHTVKSIEILFSAKSVKDVILSVMIVIILVSMTLQVIGSSLMVRLTFHSNAFLIRGYGEKGMLFTTSCISSWIIFGGNTITLFVLGISTLAGKYSAMSGGWLLSVFVLLTMLFAIIPAITYAMIKEPLPKYSELIVNGQPIIEIVKDGLMAYTVLLLAAGLPLYMIKFLDEDKASPIIDALFYSFFGMAALFEALKFCCHNNKQHFADLVGRNVVLKSQTTNMQGVYSTDIEINPQGTITENERKLELQRVKNMQYEQMKALNTHLKLQSIFAFGACLVYSFLFVLCGVLHLHSISEDDEKSFWDSGKDYTKEFLPDETLLSRFMDESSKPSYEKL